MTHTHTWHVHNFHASWKKILRIKKRERDLFIYLHCIRYVLHRSFFFFSSESRPISLLFCVPHMCQICFPLFRHSAKKKQAKPAKFIWKETTTRAHTHAYTEKEHWHAQCDSRVRFICNFGDALRFIMTPFCAKVFTVRYEEMRILFWMQTRKNYVYQRISEICAHDQRNAPPAKNGTATTVNRTRHKTENSKNFVVFTVIQWPARLQFFVLFLHSCFVLNTSVITNCLVSFYTCVCVRS